ncbi:MAG: hypothetical protein PHQ74_11415 [Crocinitomicaceae bacterium]|nr:hypothetical protein [Crocinitomicaceae bacterium]
MTKIIAILLLGMLGILTLGSCTKDYRCECVITGNNAPNPPVVNIPIDGNLHHKKAKKACKNSEKKFHNIDDDDVNCRLK